LLDIFSKNAQVSALMKIRLMGAEVFHVNGRTDITKIIVAFRNFAEAPENCSAFHVLLVVLTATTPKYSCFITAATLTVLTVRNVLSLLDTKRCNNTRLITVIKYTITDAFQTASFLSANYKRIVVRPYYTRTLFTNF
jgi:hypothetical protein